MKNMAFAQEALADHSGTSKPKPHLEAALTYVDVALTLFDKEHASFEEAKATRLRDRILAKVAALDG